MRRYYLQSGLWMSVLKVLIFGGLYVAADLNATDRPSNTLNIDGGFWSDIGTGFASDKMSDRSTKIVAGPNANATVTIDLITDGGAGNQTDDGVTSGTVSGQGTKIAVEVFARGVTTSLIGVKIEFDFKSEELKLDKVENSAFLFAIPEATGINFAATAPVTLPSSGFIGRAEFSTVVDVTGQEFTLGIKAVTLAESAASSDVVTTNDMISFNATSSPDFDGDGTVGFSDFLLFAGQYGARQGDGQYEARYDLDSDGAISFSDFLVFASSYGTQVPPSGGGGGGGGSSNPDLIVESPSVSDNTLTTGQSFTLSATVRNQGTGPSVSTTLRYYRSSNATISTSDTEVGTDSVNGLSASGTSAESISLNAPSSAGTYYYGACVNSVTGESDTDNNCSDAVSVTVSSSSGGGSDSYTPLSGLRVRNGGFTHTSIRLPFIGQVWISGCFSSGTITVNDVSYTIHSSRWQRKSGTSWVDISGTTRTGEICAYETTNPGEYRLVVEMRVNGVRRQYISENTFTVN